MAKTETGKDKTAAILTIFNPADMSAEGKKDVLKWLKRQVRFFEKYGNTMASRFCARYLYKERE